MKKTNFQPLWRFLFLLYCAVMLWLLFGRSQGWVDGLSYRQMLRQNMNLQPFFTIRNYLTVVLEGTNPSVFAHCLINLLGNVLLFIPAGFLFPRLFPKLRNFFLFFILCFLIMGFIELLQLFTLLGSFDVDDLILNLFGMLIGYLVCILIVKKPKKAR